LVRGVWSRVNQVFQSLATASTLTQQHFNIYASYRVAWRYGA